jgi:hypothetical protein
VVITDHFGAELGVNGEVLSQGVLDLTVIEHSRGKVKTDTFDTQYRITWQLGDVCVEDGPQTLTLLVWTKLNPAGNQEYTTPGRYEFNSGPTAKWWDGWQQQSSEGPSLYINVY